MQRSITKDTLFDGEIVCDQYSDGYRFSIDPVLLAHFTQPKKGARILDIGTGCGIICLILAYRLNGSSHKIEAIEIQEELVKLAKHNILANNLDDRIKVTHGDLKNILSYYHPESFETIFCNPPFYQPGEGRLNTADEINNARHQVLAKLEDIISACARVVVNKGSVNIIYPAEKTHNLLYLLQENKLELKRMQFVYSYPETDKPANLVLVEAVKNGGKGCKVLTPFYVYTQKNGSYSKAMEKLYLRKQ